MLEGKFCPDPETLWQEVGERVVLLNLKSKTYFSFDEMGSEFWKALVSSESLEQGLEHIFGNYQVDLESLRKDVRFFCDRLVARDLITIRPNQE